MLLPLLVAFLLCAGYVALTLTHTRSFGNEPWYQGKSLLPLNNFVFLCSDGTHCLSNASML